MLDMVLKLSVQVLMLMKPFKDLHQRFQRVQQHSLKCQQLHRFLVLCKHQQHPLRL